jgi:hypothetical protein
MDQERALLRHFLAALAYRTQKALRDAPPSFGDFLAAPLVRTPHELVWHMTGVIGYARTFLVGGEFRPEKLPDLSSEVTRFHQMLDDLSTRLARGEELRGIDARQLLQGPFADAMTHAGQLAMLRRLAGSPVPSENFVFADVRVENVSANQPEPAAPDLDWRPDRGHRPPGEQ